MRLNKFIIMAVIIGAFMLAAIIKVDTVPRNILDFLKDGSIDPVVSGIYAKDIADATEMTNSSAIIKYVDTDLNDDGYDDKIVIIRSPLNSGSQGDKFEVLVFDVGFFETKYSGVVRLLSQDGQVIGSLIISNKTTNGFKNIIIKTDNKDFMLKYDGDLYQYYNMDSSG